MIKILIGLSACLCSVVLGACQNKTDFNSYWYAGLAEISSFELEQARYGEIRKGDAVLIFVTEDFSASKQIKLDNPSQNPSDAVKVMKLNLSKKFNTGVYEYALMQSVFTPIDRKKQPHSLKLTASGQDWCGHVFSQLNWQPEGYRLQQHSYFENEDAINQPLGKFMLEDELFSLIRIEPKLLPLGTVKLIPNTLTARLTHRPLQAETAQAQLQKQGEISVYSLVYAYGRKVEIGFQSVFPYQIEYFSETYQDWGQTLTTKATRRKTLRLDYWQKNSNADAELRKLLDLK